MADARLTIEGRLGGVPITGPGPWLLGRSPDADVSFPDDRSCSREQVRIARDGASFTLHHLSKSSLTSIDGQLVAQPVSLRDGSVISFGVQRIVFTLIDADLTDATTIGRPAAAAVAPDRIAIGQALTVGRQAYPGQAVLDHPAVSRRHAAFERQGGRVTVRDLGSTNGTFVNGARIDRPCPLAPGDRIDVGPFQLTFDGDALVSKERTGNAELSVNAVAYDVRMAGKTVRILDGATFQILPRELVVIIGSSGSGKSTLMNILSGRALPSAGQVRLNGVDLHGAFDALKEDIAFVPQQDVLHEQLTLRQALDYAARLRLPGDTSAAQRREVVEAAAASVDLTQRLDTKIARLSGGQKKRASLASQILNRPSLLFLDEVTSGLDESTDWEIMRLLRRLADEGMTIVVVTHTLANLEALCHKIVCMGRGGVPVFVGDPAAALAFFGVQRLGEIFNRIAEAGPDLWRARFEESMLATAVAAPGELTAASAALPAPVRRREALPRRAGRVARQFGILVHRNVRLLLSDRQTLAMAAAQSCLIGGLMGYAFGSFGTGLEIVGGKTALLFLLGLTAIWIGCNGASKDIVGELVIYQRERDTNLSTVAFVAAKFLVSGVFAVLQLVLVFALTAVFAEEIPGPPLTQLAILVLAALSGTAIGLMISAFCNTRDQATTVVPLVLVPQIILAGILVPHLPRLATWFAKATVSSFWVTEAMKSVFIAAEGPVRTLTAEPSGLAVAVVAVHCLLFVSIAYAAALLRYGNRRGGA